jgi:N,N'-diacetyllegionaminate synthase
VKHLRIGSREVGDGLPCYLVAEIGINHNGDLDLARRMIDAAALAGADSVKFQSYRTEDFVVDRALTYSYWSGGRQVDESLYDMFKRSELDAKDLALLAAHSRDRGLTFHSTPTSMEGIRQLVDLGVPVLKNGSDYLTHVPLIREMGRSGLPTVLSTGMSTLAEIDDAVRAFRETGNDQLILLHCVSAYPTPPEAVHLPKIPALAAAFDCLVGFSDHTEGIVAAVAARVLGACWIEKHFTTDRTLPGPDQRFSSDPDEFQALAAGIRTVESCLTASPVGCASAEAQGRRDFRLSCVAATALPASRVLRDADVAFARPGTGLPPKEAHLIIGRRLRTPLAAGELIRVQDVE